MCVWVCVYVLSKPWEMQAKKPQSINTKEKKKSDWNTTLKMVTKPQEKRKNDEEKKKKLHKNKLKTN